jgi:hypothetical protein
LLKVNCTNIYEYANIRIYGYLAGFLKISPIGVCFVKTETSNRRPIIWPSVRGWLREIYEYLYIRIYGYLK